MEYSGSRLSCVNWFKKKEGNYILIHLHKVETSLAHVHQRASYAPVSLSQLLYSVILYVKVQNRRK
jgi:hypothetical protein